jgi:uncharacterized membrane protein YcaP (DUF421 family)
MWRVDAMFADLSVRAMFEPTLGIAEIVLRGTIIYLTLFFILRVFSRRQAGRFGPADLLVIVLIADAAQNGFGRDYSSVTEAIALVATIVAWDYIIDWLAFRFPSLRPILKAPALVLVENGVPLSSNLRRELITREELDAQLRVEGISDIYEVAVARLEGDGRISVIKHRA